MAREIERKIALIQLVLLGLFVFGLVFLCLRASSLFNPVQLRWTMLCFGWEVLVFAIPLIVFRPTFQPLRPYVRRMEAGEVLSAEEAAAFQSKVLARPFKVSLLVFFTSVGAYVLGAAQVRYFARLPWDAVVVVLILAIASGLLWAVLEYFLLEEYLRPLTRISVSAAQGRRAPAPQVSLNLKILISSITLVVASLGFFGIVAYTRAASMMEEEIGSNLTTRMRELANLIGVLPSSAEDKPSESWRFLAAEFPVSPRKHLYLVDRAGKIIATYPGTEEVPRQRLQDEELLPAVVANIVKNREGHLTDRVNRNKIVSFATIPGTTLKIVAIAAMHDVAPQLAQLLYSGFAGMGFAVLLSLGVGFLCARSITTPLADVTRTARSVAERMDLGQRVSFQTNDEVGVLAQAFNQMADGLQAYAQELEQRVADRTRALKQRTEQLEAKNSELSEFTYVASHDLRTPLINLEGFSRVLQESLAALEEAMRETSAGANGVQGQMPSWPQLQQEINESLDFILGSVAKMSFLVEALLELSRIDAQPYAQESLDTRKIFEEIRTAFQFQIAQKKITVVTGNLPPVTGDSVRINQVFSNLIDNAIKYMPAQADPRIEVGCKEKDDDYYFFVRDTGPGLRPADQSKVFRPFTRLAGNGVPGDGIGLTAVRKIVEKHGGRIWVESELGKGCTFWFTLPRKGARGKTDLPF